MEQETKTKTKTKTKVLNSPPSIISPLTLVKKIWSRKAAIVTS